MKDLVITCNFSFQYKHVDANPFISEHLAYFLLAHLTDPRDENLSGIDCQTYMSEFGKSLNLSVKIDDAIQKVIKILS